VPAKTPGGKATGRGDPDLDETLDDAEDDGSDEGERDIRSENAQFADERIDEFHWEHLPWFTSCSQITHQASKAFPTDKVSVAVTPEISTASRPRQRGKKFVKSRR
jgi:hypothetical protein